MTADVGSGFSATIMNGIVATNGAQNCWIEYQNTYPIGTMEPWPTTIVQNIPYVYPQYQWTLTPTMPQTAESLLIQAKSRRDEIKHQLAGVSALTDELSKLEKMIAAAEAK